ncbi:MAG TPA: Trk system potassium transporter TrkA [Firmicutes bacterium]|nr:Trk system potassium transporter TrkA [Candidatus Fermentithermobacillaceae bacterium]
MKAIVIGAGKVGYHIAEQLSRESNDVVLIDTSEEALAPAREALDVLPVLGNGASPAVLEEAGVSQADLVIAVATHDEVNIIACLTAKYYGVPTTVARVRNPDYTLHAKALVHGQTGIDLIIHPERLAALEIVKLLKTPSAGEVSFYADGKIQLLGLKITSANSPVVDKPLWQLGLRNFLVVAISRDERLMIPDGTSEIKLDDYIYVLGRTGEFEGSVFLSGRIPDEIKTITIVGGGETGLRTCEILSEHREEGLSIKLIEKDPEKARWLAERLPGVLVINADGTRMDVLQSERVGESDALVAATGSEEVNLLVAMLGKRLGIKEIIVLLGRQEYAALADTIGVQATVVPRVLTASTILKLLRKRKLVDLSFLKQGQAEVMEVEISEDAPIAGKELRDSGLPRNSLVGTIIRGPEVIIPHGFSRVLPRDRVVVFAEHDAVARVQKLLGL